MVTVATALLVKTTENGKGRTIRNNRRGGDFSKKKKNPAREACLKKIHASSCASKKYSCNGAEKKILQTSRT